MKYLALTDNDNDNNLIAVVIFDDKVKERIKLALEEHFDARINELVVDDRLNECLGGCIRELSFSMNDSSYTMNIEQTWVY